MMHLWDKVRNHSGVCTCTDCQRWSKIEQELTARGEQQAYHEWTAEEVASHDEWYATRNQDQAATVKVACEVCGALYEPEHGYYEAGEYSYCAECCNW